MVLIAFLALYLLNTSLCIDLHTTRNKKSSGNLKTRLRTWLILQQLEGVLLRINLASTIYSYVDKIASEFSVKIYVLVAFHIQLTLHGVQRL